MRDEGEGVAGEGGTRGEKEVGISEDSGRSGKRALERVVVEEDVMVVRETVVGGVESGEEEVGM